MNFCGFRKMIRSVKTLGALLVLLPLAGAAFALDSARIAATEPAHARRSVRAESARNDTAMQALCREVLVDTDEGYGVTNRESRFICDESR